LAERDGGQVQRVKHGGRAIRVEATGKQLTGNALQRRPNIRHGVKRRQLPVADFGAATIAGEGEAVLLVAMVEIAKGLAAKGRRAAGDAILLEMAAETKGHEASKKRALALGN